MSKDIEPEDRNARPNEFEALLKRSQPRQPRVDMAAVFEAAGKDAAGDSSRTSPAWGHQDAVLESRVPEVAAAQVQLSGARPPVQVPYLAMAGSWVCGASLGAVLMFVLMRPASDGNVVPAEVHARNSGQNLAQVDPQGRPQVTPDAGVLPDAGLAADTREAAASPPGGRVELATSLASVRSRYRVVELAEGGAKSESRLHVGYLTSRLRQEPSDSSQPMHRFEHSDASGDSHAYAPERRVPSKRKLLEELLESSTAVF